MKTTLGTVFAGISAVAAVALAGLAYWGAFFTDIPETLISQLRVDILTAKEEAVDLRRDKRVLQEELGKIQAQLDMVHMEVASAEASRTSLEDTLENMRLELASTRGELMAIENERRAYFGETLDAIVADFALNVNDHLEQLTDNALRALQLPEFRSWVMREDTYNRKTSAAIEHGNTREVRLLVEERLDAIPSEWRNVYFRANWTRENLASAGDGSSASAGYGGTEPKPGTQSDEEFLKSYQERFTHGNDAIPATGGRVFESFFKLANVNLLLESDRNKLLNRFQDFTSNNEVELSLPLNVQLSGGWTDDEVVERAEQVLTNLRSTRTLLSELKMHLLSMQ